MTKSVDANITTTAPQTSTVTLSGLLTRDDTGAGIANQTVTLSYVPQGSTTHVTMPSATTNTNGAYTSSVHLATGSGTYTFTGNWAGIAGSIGPSMRTLTVTV